MIVDIKNESLPFKIESDLAGEVITYIYLSIDKKNCLVSNSIEILLAHSSICKPLTVRKDSINTLLHNGAVPTPYTPYENIYRLGIGDSAVISQSGSVFEIKIEHNFPFKNEHRGNVKSYDESKALSLLANAVQTRIYPNMKSFLFHSAGKDSNSTLLAMAGAGWQDKLTLVTHKGIHDNCESKISKEIAIKLGFKHRTLDESKMFEMNNKVIEKQVIDFATHLAIPSTDNVSLAYAYYDLLHPDMKYSNIIDSSGNDVYIGHIPPKKEFILQNFSSLTRPFRIVYDRLHGINPTILDLLLRNKIECVGLIGINKKMTNNIFQHKYPQVNWITDTYQYRDYLDFRSRLWGTHVEQSIFIQKVRNYAQVYNSNLILPWTDKEVAKYFYSLDELLLFDRKQLKNKLVLREMLKKHDIVDSDKIGKYGYKFNYHQLNLKNWEFVIREISSCAYWNADTKDIVNQWKEKAKQKTWSGGQAARNINRLFILSLWLNYSKWL